MLTPQLAVTLHVIAITTIHRNGLEALNLLALMASGTCTVKK